MPDTYLLIFLCALITFAVRSGGYVLMSYFGTVNHRVEAALNAVPIAVLSALVAPTILTGQWPDALAIALVCLFSMRMSMLPAIVLSVIALVFMRQVAGL
ncbi:MAG: AzlD domain-containing protein [Cognatishimia sp.]|uniref:AzlD family protein n=1 Tax=Cognatishimia sp. TaxID=2211648 RepID=UPI003B8E5A91